VAAPPVRRRRPSPDVAIAARGSLAALAADRTVMGDNAVLGFVDPQIVQSPTASGLKALGRKRPEDIEDRTLILADVDNTLGVSTVLPLAAHHAPGRCRLTQQVTALDAGRRGRGHAVCIMPVLLTAFANGVRSRRDHVVAGLSTEAGGEATMEPESRMGMVADDRPTAEPYNFEHFRAKHLLEDTGRIWRGQGIEPGAPAPDFELPRADGGSLRLSELRGEPVLLHFGSPT